MITLLRKIRKQLLSQNKFSAYLLYAIGEILLVVIGILIALQINTWNQNRINRTTETKYLNNLVNDLQLDTLFMKRFVFDRFERKMEGLNLAKSYNRGLHQVQDTVLFLSKVSYGAVFSAGIVFLTSTTFDELISTGNLQLISDEEVKKRIIQYYNRVKSNIKLLENYQSDNKSYMKFIDGSRPFDSTKLDFIDPADQKFMMQKLKSEEVVSLANLEITKGNRIRDSLKNLFEQAVDLIALLQKQKTQ